MHLPVFVIFHPQRYFLPFFIVLIVIPICWNQSKFNTRAQQIPNVAAGGNIPAKQRLEGESLAGRGRTLSIPEK